MVIDVSGRVLFLQCTNAGQYPPILNSSRLLARAGWHVTVLSSPSVDTVGLTVPSGPDIRHISTPLRRQNAVRPVDYAIYGATAIATAARVRPHFIYASDPLAALPALLASKISGAAIVYHEHDSPVPGAARSWIARWRAEVVRAARLIVFPNEARARIAQAELGFSSDRLRVVWNVPRRGEFPALAPSDDEILRLHYHGNISPMLVPEGIVEAVRRLDGRVRLRVAGYEAPSARGYVRRLLDLGRGSDNQPLVEFLGQVPRGRLLSEAATAHIGLATMPRMSQDVNVRHMVGASNKVFDYMAAGLPLLVSDLADWQDTFVARGFGRACDPDDPGSVAAELSWFVENAAERRAMAARNRVKVETDWNYDTAFAKVLDVLNDA